MLCAITPSQLNHRRSKGFGISNLFRSIFAADERSRRNPQAVKRRLRLEPLENRRLLTLLGVAPGYPLIFFDSTGNLQYTAATHALEVTATPLSLLLSASSTPATITGNAALDINALVDNSGNLIGGNGNPNFQVTGTVVINGNTDSGTLLTGNVLQFGYQYNSGTSTPQFDFRFQFTGGLLQSYYVGADIGVTMDSENSNFTGSFGSDFSGSAKGEVGLAKRSAPARRRPRPTWASRSATPPR